MSVSSPLSPFNISLPSFPSKIFASLFPVILSAPEVAMIFSIFLTISLSPPFTVRVASVSVSAKSTVIWFELLSEL